MSDDMLAVLTDPTAPPIVDPDVFEDGVPLGPLPVDLKAATMVDITRRVAVIKKLERKSDFLVGAMRQTTKFYRDRLDQIEASIDEIKGQIRAYMDYAGVRNIPTPVGTAYQKRLEEVEWDDAKVMAWLGTQGPELASRCTRTKVELDKNAIKAFMAETGTVVPGITFTPKEKVYVR